MGYSASKDWLVVFKWRPHPRLSPESAVWRAGSIFPEIKWSTPMKMSPGMEIIKAVLSPILLSVVDSIVVAAAYPSLTDGAVLAWCKLGSDDKYWTVFYDGPRLLSTRQMAIYEGCLYLASNESCTMVFDLRSCGGLIQANKVIARVPLVHGDRQSFLAGGIG